MTIIDENAQEQQLQDRNNLRETLNLYLRNWSWFLLCILLFTILAWVYLRYATPIYSSRATVVIKDARTMKSSGPTSMLSDMGMFGTMTTNMIDNEIEILKSKRLMQKVVDNLDLNIQYFTEGKIKTSEIYQKSPIKLKFNSVTPDFHSTQLEIEYKNDTVNIITEDGKRFKTSFNKIVSIDIGDFIINKVDKSSKSSKLYVNISSIPSTTNYILSNLDVNLAGEFTTVIDIDLLSNLPNKSEDILNELISVYNEDAILDKNMESMKTAEFIDDRITIIQSELGDVEKNKESFKKTNNLTDIPLETGLNLQAMKGLKENQLQIETQLEMVSIFDNHISNQSVGDLLPANIAAGSTGVNESISRYNEMVLERNRLLEGGTLDNPLVKEIDSQLSKLKNSISSTVHKQKASLQSQSNQLSSELNKIKSDLGQIPRQENVFRDIERQQQIKENLYLMLLKQREEAAISLAITSPKAKIVDAAYTFGSPVLPKKGIYYLGAIIIGFLIPFGTIYSRELLKNKVESKRDLEKLAPGVPIIGEIPKQVNDIEGMVVTKELTPLSEAFRIVRTNLQYYFSKTGKDDKGKIILVTSTIKSEGKTFISINLAHIFAQLKNKKSILIGADIRNPQLQRYYREAKKFQGLTEYLYSEQTILEDVIVSSKHDPSLDIIYSGAIPPNPAELLMSDRMKYLLDKLKEKYDYILIDSAPILLVSDTLHISSFSDATVYVVRSNTTLKELIAHPVHEEREGRIKNLNFVLNEVPFGDSRYAYKYGYKYGYQYGYQHDDLIVKKGFKNRIKNILNR